MNHVPELFGSMVFNDKVMKARLPKEVYRSLKNTIQRGAPLDPGVADVVAACMKDWAVSKGATHFTHWFQPMTGITAEKHDSFINPCGDGSVIMDLKPAATPPGIPPATPSSRKTPCASPLPSAATTVRCWTRKLPCCAAWMPSANRRFAFLLCSARTSSG